MQVCATRDDEPIVFLAVGQRNASFESAFNQRTGDNLPIYQKRENRKT